MIIELFYFLFNRWRRWKYKADYASDARIEVDRKNHLMRYRLPDKETYVLYQWPSLLVTSIELWDNGSEISKKEKALLFIDVLDYIYKYANVKACVEIDKNHPDCVFWATQCKRMRHLIDSVKELDLEEEFQTYLDALAKTFEEGNVLEINGKIIDNRADLEQELRKNKPF